MCLRKILEKLMKYIISIITMLSIVIILLIPEVISNYLYEEILKNILLKYPLLASLSIAMLFIAVVWAIIIPPLENISDWVRENLKAAIGFSFVTVGTLTFLIWFVFLKTVLPTPPAMPVPSPIPPTTAIQSPMPPATTASALLPTPAPTSPPPGPPTSEPPTDTPTNTPIPPTDTPTNTPIPPTDTPTNTPMPTNTPDSRYLTLNPPSACAGQLVTITGHNFTPGHTFVWLSWDGSAVTPVSITPVDRAGNFTITFYVPALTTPDAHTVEVNYEAAGPVSASFTVNSCPAPTITDIAPSTVFNNVANLVTITGTNFLAVPTVTIGTTDSIAGWLSSTNLNITVPMDFPAGFHTVRVINPDLQESDLWGTFTVANPGPALIDMNPDTGANNVPTLVTIFGSNFVTTPLASLGGYNLTGVTYIDANTLSATVPAGLPVGFYTLTITNPLPSGPPASLTNAFTITYPAPSVTAIVPNTGVNTATTSVIITGTNFYATPTARLGVVSLLNVTYINATTLTATVPAGMAAGSYPLFVINPGPGNPTGSLPNAFTVTNPNIPDTTLESPYVCTFGKAGTSPGYGDDDQIQLIFFEIPATVTHTLYLRIYDPDCGGGVDERYGSWNTETRFSLYGEQGAYTEPEAKLHHPTDTGVTSGALLFRETFGVNSLTDGRWYTFADVAPTAGEYISANNTYVFKLSVVGVSGDDGNLYNVVLSISPTENIAPVGSRVFAYSWTYRLPVSGQPRLYPYVVSSTMTVTQHNWDFDYGSGGITLTTPLRTLTVGPGDISGNDEEASSSYEVIAGEQNTTWVVSTMVIGRVSSNDVTLWVKDQDGKDLPIFTRSTMGNPPPSTMRHEPIRASSTGEPSQVYLPLIISAYQ